MGVMMSRRRQTAKAKREKVYEKEDSKKLEDGKKPDPKFVKKRKGK